MLTCFQVASILFALASVHHGTDGVINSVVWESFIEETLYPHKSPKIVVLGRIHTLVRTSNVSAERSATGARQVSPIPAQHQQRSMLPRTTCRNYTFSCWSSSHLFPHICYAPPPPTKQHKKNCKEQLQIKFDIALRQNCEQSATVWWSIHSSARQWRVSEGCLTLNKSGDNNREPT
jgi:hypothetical protein